MRKHCSAVVAAIAALGLFAAAALTAATAQTPRVYIGALSCNVSGGGGFIFGSTKEMHCVFLTTAGTSERYHGSINRYGVDVGYTGAVHTLYHVFSLGSDRAASVLAGDFVGTQESVAVGGSSGVGGGGKILIGGRNKEIVLQSAGIQQTSGWNFADGVAEISLRPGG